AVQLPAELHRRVAVHAQRSRLRRGRQLELRGEQRIHRRRSDPDEYAGWGADAHSDADADAYSDPNADEYPGWGADQYAGAADAHSDANADEHARSGTDEYARWVIRHDTACAVELAAAEWCTCDVWHAHGQRQRVGQRRRGARRVHDQQRARLHGHRAAVQLPTELHRRVVFHAQL